jgi:DNA mismatch repair ATPase MutS
LQEELDDDYLRTVEGHLQELKLGSGILMSAALGAGNKGAEYVLLRVPERRLVDRLLPDRDGFSFQVSPRDESGDTALSELRDRGENSTANAVARSADHVLSFFAALRAELGFYIGCMNLLDRLSTKGRRTCVPCPAPRDTWDLTAEGLYDVTLALMLDGEIAGNDLDADGKRLVMITGANGGGKSTFMRGIGLAYLMMQCGMPVPASSFRAGTCTGLFTHYTRGEDTGMARGKLDEELRRMSAIADAMTPGCLLLCNESFASTNEREGSEIARGVVRALIETGVRVVYVTHLHDLAHGFFRQGRDDVLFLRAGLGEQGKRTYKLEQGEPEPTSHGEDTYRQVFGISE